MARDSIDIRPADAHDAWLLVEVRDLMLREMGIDETDKLDSLKRTSIPVFEAWLAEGRMAGFVAACEGQVIGGVSLTMIQTQPQLNAQSGQLANIFGLFVYPAYRGRGVATTLVNRCIDFSREQGVELVTLHAAHRARPLYERIGFEASPEMRFFVG